MFGEMQIEYVPIAAASSARAAMSAGVASVFRMVWSIILATAAAFSSVMRPAYPGVLAGRPGLVPQRQVG